jgi:uncharacterized membrane protein
LFYGVGITVNRSAALKATMYLAIVVMAVATLWGFTVLAKSSPWEVLGFFLVAFVAIVWWMFYELAIHSAECREEIKRLEALK